LRIAPTGPTGIELEQDVRMFDLPGRRLAFADHLRQCRSELCSNLVYRSGLMKVEEAAHRC
jgi:hypothetical protein